MTGSQGTGKTTLMKAVGDSEHFSKFTIVPSTARAALKAGFQVNRAADPLSQLVTTAGRIAIEDRLYRESGNTISDRTPLDSFAYTTYQMTKVWEAGTVPTYYWNVSRDLIVEHMHKYDAIIYFPIYWGPKDDGVRDPDAAYQKDIDDLILQFIDSFGLQVFPMIKGDTQARLRHLTKVVN